jgi:hypothetical protein
VGFAGVGDGVGDDVGDVLVGEGVPDLPTAALTAYHPGRPQDPQVLGDQGLADAERVDQLMHAALAAAQFGDQGDAQRGGQGSEQFAGGLVPLGIGHDRATTAFIRPQRRS